jgi:catechol 2,3-dioxygenase-like lactoylglutathione lyase family enzyme
VKEVFGGVRQVTIRSRDMALSRAFYSERLGFAVMDEEEGRHVRVNLGTFRLRIEGPSPAGTAGGHGTTLTFRVENLSRTATELVNRGIGFEAGTSAGGEDYLETFDPDGYRLVFTERL